MINNPESENEAEAPREEEFKISGEDVLQKVKELLKEGRARRIIIKNEYGKTILEVPLAIGVVGAMIAPALAAIGAGAALLTKCTLVVIRDPEKK
jgi:hypothetical protein